MYITGTLSPYVLLICVRKWVKAKSNWANMRHNLVHCFCVVVFLLTSERQIFSHLLSLNLLTSSTYFRPKWTYVASLFYKDWACSNWEYKFWYCNRYSCVVLSVGSEEKWKRIANELKRFSSDKSMKMLLSPL